MFEFETKEQREAWRVVSHMITEKGFPCVSDTETIVILIKAAARFDQREETCGIEPLSDKHNVLAVAALEDILLKVEGDPTCQSLGKLGLLVWREKTEYWDTTIKGRAVLQRLNEMCKVSK